MASNAEISPDPALTLEAPDPPDVSHLITEDDTPVDNPYSEKLMRLLTEPLYASWNPGRPFVAMANVGLFGEPKNPALVPDVMLSMDVSVVGGDKMMEKPNRAYMVWEFGKSPDMVIEIVSPTKGGELDRKIEAYARIGVRFYVVYDPTKDSREERLQQFVLIGMGYEPYPVHVFKGIGLSLVEWEGDYEGCTQRWLRWADETGQLIPTGAERASAETRRANEEAKRADEEAKRAEALAAKLRDLGIDPEDL